MKLNPDKCHLLVSGYKHENIRARIGEVKIWESSKQNSLEVVIDTDLSFNKYVSSLCKKDGKELSVLSRLWWNRFLKTSLNIVHKSGSLRIVYRDYNSSFKYLLKKDNYVCIHHRNIQFGRSTIQSKENFSGTIMSNIFPARVLNYILRSKTDFFRNTVNTAKLSLNSLRYFASKIWSMTPIEIKNSATVEMFKSKISNWEPNNSDCKICQVYLHRTGYINLVDE